MKLILVRHGQTKHNAESIVQGQKIDIGLNDTGIAQAQAAGHALKHESIDVCYSSDAKRARETAQHILEHHPHTPLYFEPLLRERSAGIYDGLHRNFYHDAAHSSGMNWCEFIPEQGESHVMVGQRAMRAHHILCETHENQTILVVSHGALITTWLAHLHHAPFEKSIFKTYHPDNCAITILHLDKNGNISSARINESKHLETIG